MHFTSPKKQLGCDLKIKLNGKSLYETDSVKYLEIQTNKRLAWKWQNNHVADKLNKANAMLSKLKHVLDIKTLRLVYYTKFESLLFCASLVWAQNTNSVRRLQIFKKGYCLLFSITGSNLCRVRLSWYHMVKFWLI